MRKLMVGCLFVLFICNLIQAKDLGSVLNELRGGIYKTKKSVSEVSNSLDSLKKNLQNIPQVVSPKVADVPQKSATTFYTCDSETPVNLTFVNKEQFGSKSRMNFFKDVMGIDESEFKDKEEEIKKRFFVEMDPQNRDVCYLIKGAENRIYRCGFFKELRLGDLRKSAAEKLISSLKSAKFSVIEAADDDVDSLKHVDIGFLQADKENIDAVFQVASNFNALETLNADDNIDSGVSKYFADHTQGPIASISAVPGLLYRQFYYFYESRKTMPVEFWRQRGQNSIQNTDDSNLKLQINLLDDLGVKTQNGYVWDPTTIVNIQEYPLKNDSNSFTKHSDYFKIGFHENIQVAFGATNEIKSTSDGDHIQFYDPNQIINQVFAAALNIGQSPICKGTTDNQAKLILKWTYEATLKAALVNNKKRVYLTRIGSGVFGNNQEWIDQAIIDAVNDLKKSGLEIVLNNFKLNDEVESSGVFNRLRNLVAETGGSYIVYKNGQETIKSCTKMTGNVTQDNFVEIPSQYVINADNGFKWILVPELESINDAAVLIKLNSSETYPKIKLTDPLGNSENSFNFHYVDINGKQLPRGLYYWKLKIWNEIHTGIIYNNNVLAVTWDSGKKGFFYKNTKFKGKNYSHPSVSLWGLKDVEAKKQSGVIAKRDFFKFVMGVSESNFVNYTNREKFIDRVNKKIGNKKQYPYGDMKLISIEELDKIIAGKKQPGGGTFKRIKPTEDVYIESLQAKPENRDAVFQLASNFHALEGGCNPRYVRSISSSKTLKNNLEQIAQYAVQGEDAAISAAPGLIYKMYYGDYVNLLSYFAPPTGGKIDIITQLIIPIDGEGKIDFDSNKSGYMYYLSTLKSYLDNKVMDETFISNFTKKVNVSFLEGVCVTSGALVPGEDKKESENYKKNKSERKHLIVNDLAQKINQVFSSAVDLDQKRTTQKYVSTTNSIQVLAQLILYAMYEGVIKSAFAYNKKRVFLTLVGAGSFKNNINWIANAIKRQKQNIKNFGLEVILMDFDPDNQYRPKDQDPIVALDNEMNF